MAYVMLMVSNGGYSQPTLCHPVDVSQLVVGLRPRHLASWRQPTYHPQALNSKRYKGQKGKRPQSRRLTASLSHERFINTYEVMKGKRKSVVIL
eukprot:436694-Pelagomonas_calceolata.AAC.1